MVKKPRKKYITPTIQLMINMKKNCSLRKYTASKTAKVLRTVTGKMSKALGEVEV